MNHLLPLCGHADTEVVIQPPTFSFLDDIYYIIRGIDQPDTDDLQEIVSHVGPNIAVHPDSVAPGDTRLATANLNGERVIHFGPSAYREPIGATIAGSTSTGVAYLYRRNGSTTDGFLATHGGAIRTFNQTINMNSGGSTNLSSVQLPNDQWNLMIISTEKDTDNVWVNGDLHDAPSNNVQNPVTEFLELGIYFGNTNAAWQGNFDLAMCICWYNAHFDDIQEIIDYVNWYYGTAF